MQHFLANVQINVNICFKYLFRISNQKRYAPFRGVFTKKNIKINIFFMCFIYLTKDSLTRTFFIVKYLRHY